MVVEENGKETLKLFSGDDSAFKKLVQKAKDNINLLTVPENKDFS
jgi:hypothetical protein